MSKKLHKYIWYAFDSFDKILIILSAATGGISIISFKSAAGVPVGIANVNFSLAFFFYYNNHKKNIRNNKKKKKKSIKDFCVS